MHGFQKSYGWRQWLKKRGGGLSIKSLDIAQCRGLNDSSVRAPRATDQFHKRNRRWSSRILRSVIKHLLSHQGMAAYGHFIDHVTGWTEGRYITQNSGMFKVWKPQMQKIIQHHSGIRVKGILRFSHREHQWQKDCYLALYRLHIGGLNDLHKWCLQPLLKCLPCGEGTSEKLQAARCSYWRSGYPNPSALRKRLSNSGSNTRRSTKNRTTRENHFLQGHHARITMTCPLSESPCREQGTGRAGGGGGICTEGPWSNPPAGGCRQREMVWEVRIECDLVVQLSGAQVYCR